MASAMAFGVEETDLPVEAAVEARLQRGPNPEADKLAEALEKIASCPYPDTRDRLGFEIMFLGCRVTARQALTSYRNKETDR